jgi:hypothetical protein
MAKLITIDAALSDKTLLGAALGDPASWSTWLAVLRAAFGLPLNAEQAATFAAVAGGRAPPSHRVRELWTVAGRRSGKSRIAAAVGVFLALFVKHKLAPGERGVVLILAASTDQSRVVFSYCKAFLESSPVLAKELVEATRSELRLKNGITIAVHANSFRTVRGRTLCAAVFDEVAIWRDEASAQPDSAVYSAVLPALLTTKGMLVGISTGFKRAGLLFEKHRDHYGQDTSDVLVVQGSTTQFNGTLTEADIAAQRAADPAAAATEWDGSFREQTEGFLSEEVLDAAVDRGRPLELPPRPGVAYVAFTDAAGGAAKGDAYSVAIAHREGAGSEVRVVVDVVRGVVGKFDPQQVTRDHAALARQYGIASVSGDRYAAEWVTSAWRDAGITYLQADQSKSQHYLEVAPLFARRAICLPDHPRLLLELRRLEKRTGRNGKVSVDHVRGSHDDHAAAVAGAIRAASTAPRSLWAQGDLVGDGPAPVPTRAEVVFVVFVAGERGVGTVLFARSRIGRTPIVTVLDFDVLPLAPASLRGVVERLLGLSKQCGGAPAFAFATSAIAAEIERIGQAVQVIDRLAKDEMLAVSAAAHIGAGRVKLSAQARERSATLPFGIMDGSTADDDDQVCLAALIGFAVALDEGRELS